MAGNLEVLLEWIKNVQQQTIIHVINKVNPHSKLLAKLPPWVYEHVTLDNTIAVFLHAGEVIDKLVALAYQHSCLLAASSAIQLVREIVITLRMYRRHG